MEVIARRNRKEKMSVKIYNHSKRLYKNSIFGWRKTRRGRMRSNVYGSWHCCAAANKYFLLPVEFPPLICVIIWECFTFHFFVPNKYEKFDLRIFFTTWNQLSSMKALLRLNVSWKINLSLKEKISRELEAFLPNGSENFSNWKILNSFFFHTLETHGCAPYENVSLCAEMENRKTFMFFIRNRLNQFTSDTRCGWNGFYARRLSQNSEVN